MPDDRGILRPDETAQVKDEDFVIESYSHKEAFAPVPEDTTLGDERAGPATVAEAVVDERGETATAAVPAAGEQTDEGESSQSRMGQTAAPAEAVKPKPKKSTDSHPRTAKLKHEIDTLTYQRREGERQLAELNRQIEGRRAAASRDAVLPTPTKAADAYVPMPTVPKYRDYATDEEYETAVGKYHTDLAAWQTDQQTQLEQRITAGVESRFRGAGDDAAFQQAVERLEATKAKVMASKPDWDEKRAALGSIQSAWYDPASHGPENTTPFLTDLARTLMMQGKDEGAELLYWLGSDPDRAQAVADLHPGVVRMRDGTVYSPLRDALVHAPSVLPLLEHFATEDGQREFEALKQMHPLRINQAIGALSVRLAGASSGSPAASHPITKAHPSARPPVGTPGARSIDTGTGKKPDFLTWKIDEDAKEILAQARAIGVVMTLDDARAHALTRAG